MLRPLSVTEMSTILLGVLMLYAYDQLDSDPAKLVWVACIVASPLIATKKHIRITNGLPQTTNMRHLLAQLRPSLTPQAYFERSPFTEFAYGVVGERGFVPSEEAHAVLQQGCSTQVSIFTASTFSCFFVGFNPVTLYCVRAQGVIKIAALFAVFGGYMLYCYATSARVNLTEDINIVLQCAAADAPERDALG